MANGYLAWDLLFLEERVRQLERRVTRRHLRDTQNPFDIPVNEFITGYRVSQELAMHIIGAVERDLRRERSSGLTPSIQVLLALQFYGHGSYQSGIGNNALNNVSQPSVSRAIQAVTNAINQRLLRLWIKFPMTPEERAAARQKFSEATFPFEGALGAIDCSYINILAPREHEENYVNHHGNHSLNVQAIVDPDCRILNVNARFPGARNDAYIWSVSAVRRAMDFHYQHGERRTWLIGDAGYPLEPWLMTPVNHFPEDTRQHQYTQQLCKARTVVERFFGIWKSTFRCLSYQRVLLYDPGTAGRIVNACAVLHNMRLQYRLPMDDFYDPNNALEYLNQGQVGNNQLQVDNRELERPRGPLVVARRIQRQIMQERFPQYRDGDAN